MGIEEKNNGTTTVGRERDRELLYQERINFLMTQTGNQAGGNLYRCYRRQDSGYHDRRRYAE